jgi:dTDP-4-amino-4,6-dideoxygalactose transaminase
LREYLGNRGIAPGIHYPVPIHLQPAYQDLGYSRGSFPVTEQCAHSILSLPMYAELTHEQVDLVARTIRAFTTADSNGHGQSVGRPFPDHTSATQQLS